MPGGDGSEVERVSKRGAKIEQRWVGDGLVRHANYGACLVLMVDGGTPAPVLACDVIGCEGRY